MLKKPGTAHAHTSNHRFNRARIYGPAVVGLTPAERDLIEYIKNDASGYPTRVSLARNTQAKPFLAAEMWALIAVRGITRYHREFVPSDPLGACSVLRVATALCEYYAGHIQEVDE